MEAESFAAARRIFAGTAERPTEAPAVTCKKRRAGQTCSGQPESGCLRKVLESRYISAKLLEA